MSIFQAQPKIRVGQNSVSFLSQNALEYSPKQKIVLEISDDLEFFDPSKSYVKFDFEIDLNSPTYNYLVQLDPFLGSQVLFDTVYVYNRSGVLLEEYPNYPSWVNIQNLYQENETVINKLGLTEGVVAYNPEQRSWNGEEYSRFTNSQFNPYFKKDATGNVTYNKVRMSMKLRTGIFSSKNIFFNRLMGGLRLELILNDQKNVFKLFKNAITAGSCPALSHVNANAKYTGFAQTDSPATAVYLSWKNNMMLDVNRVPFCVGERILIAGLTDKQKITSIDIATVGGEKFIKLSFTTGITNAIADVDSGVDVTSTSYDDNTSKPTFKVSNVEMVVEEITVTDAYKKGMEKALMENGRVSYNCVCAQNYRHSVLASDVASTVNLNLNNRMAKSILVVPTTDSNATMDVNIKQFTNFRNGISGNWDKLKQYQWTYSNKLNPDRPISTNKTQSSDQIYDGQYLAEIEKGLALGSIVPNSFKHIKTNAVIGRCLALENQIYNCQQKDFQLSLEFNGSTGDRNSKLLNCWLVHVRRFDVTTSGVEIMF
jgi:hypothetical protein